MHNVSTSAQQKPMGKRGGTTTTTVETCPDCFSRRGYAMFGYLQGASSYQRAKVVMVGLAPILAIASVTIAPTSEAGASTPPIRCLAISGELTGAKLTMCSSKVHGRGRAVLNTNGSPSTFSWANGKKTTASLAFKSGVFDCRMGSTQEDASGVVSSSTTSYIPVGSKVSAYLCVTPSGAVSSVPGKPFTFKQP